MSDRGPQFVAEFMKELNRMLGIETRLSMVFHPQMDGQMERIVKIVDGRLCSFLFSLFYLIFLFLLFSIFYF